MPANRPITTRARQPSAMRAAATVNGVKPSTLTLMNRNDQPQTKANKTTRRMGRTV